MKKNTDPRIEIYESYLADMPRGHQLEVLKSLHTHGLKSVNLEQAYLDAARNYAEHYADWFPSWS